MMYHRDMKYKVLSLLAMATVIIIGTFFFNNTQAQSVSPQISSLSLSFVDSNLQLKIEGFGFSTSSKNTVTIDKIGSFCPEDFTCEQNRRYQVISDNGRSLHFYPRLILGSSTDEYIVHVKNPESGTSNGVNISLSTTSSKISQEQYIQPNTQTITSGQSVVLSFRAGNDNDSSKLFIYCPKNITAIKEGKNICNKWINYQSIPSRTILRIFNESTWPEYVIPNFYVYYKDDPNFAIGVSTQIKILPRVATTSIISTRRSGGIIDSVVRFVVPTYSDISSISTQNRSTYSPNPIPTARPTASPTPQPITSPITTITPTSSITPRNSPTPRPTTISSPTASPTPFRSPTPRPSVTITPSPTNTNSPSPTPYLSPSPTPIYTPSPSPIPSTSPAPTASPTPTPSPIPSTSPAPTASPTPTPSPLPTVNPNPSPSSIPSTSPSPTPTLSPSPSASPSSSPSAQNNNKSLLASIFEALREIFR